jgi:hypothetical protein
MKRIGQEDCVVVDIPTTNHVARHDAIWSLANSRSARAGDAA